MKTHIFLLATMLVLTTSCSQLKKRGEMGSPQGPGPISGPADSQDQPQPVPLSNQSPKKVALILGGGGARTLAHAGVIRALLAEKIEISHVSGIEWGSLVAASFAASGQSHDMDWKLYKLDALNLKFGSGFFGLGGKKSIQDLSEYFADNFSKVSVDRAKINFSCSSQTIGASSSRVVDKGSMEEGLKQCIPYPPFFEVGKSVSANTSSWKLAQALRKNEAEIIVFIDVLSPNILNDALIKKDKMVTLLWTQSLESNQVTKSLIKDSFSISLDRYSIFDFSNRKAIEAAGEKAGAEIARALKQRYSL